MILCVWQRPINKGMSVIRSTNTSASTPQTKLAAKGADAGCPWGLPPEHCRRHSTYIRAYSKQYVEPDIGPWDPKCENQPKFSPYGLTAEFVDLRSRHQNNRKLLFTHRKNSKQVSVIWSTKIKPPENKICATIHNDMNPPKITEKINQLFCYSGYINTKEGTIYVDLTGRFPT